MISRIRLERFTAFESLDFKPGQGINVLMGANGTGKTHLMKVAYAACDITKSGLSFSDKIVRTFLPSERSIGRLVKRRGMSSTAHISVWRGKSRLQLSFSNHAKDASDAKVITTGATQWNRKEVESVFIPVKEMLSHGPGFRSLYTQREIHYEEIYADILDRAYRPVPRGPTDQPRRQLLNALQAVIEGKVLVKNEEFFLRNKRGNLEFTLLAEGMRKLGLLWLLVQNATLLKGSVLFWDEPEANLSARLFGTLMKILLELQRLGVQIFIATHDYSLLKELDLAAEDDDAVDYHVLYRSEAEDELMCEHAQRPFDLENSPITQAMTSLYDREIERSLKG